ncbi:MAG: hypothetical protein ACYTFK_09805 [Planctomycetota bacterium]|jgi:hypothetical protein
MNNKQNNKPQDQDAEKIKEIPKWAQRYAQNRTLTIFVLMLMIVLIGGFIAFPISFGIAAFMGGNMSLTGISVALFAAVLIFLTIFLAKFGGKNKGLIDQLIDQRIYGKEGTVSMPQPKLSKKMKRLDIVVGIVYLVLLIGSMNLGMLGYIPVKYFIPFTALFIVPFGIYQYLIMRPRLGPVILIFPILYAIHAILIIAGVPIYYTGRFAVPLNMFIPVVYNLLAFVVGHLYSRYALKKLKTAAHLQENANEH